jgi:hypothetical protein
MTSQEQANHPPADRPSGREEVQEPAQASGCDVQLGIPCDYIDEALEETMVASDPPPLTPQAGIGSPGHNAGAEVDRASQ